MLMKTKAQGSCCDPNEKGPDLRPAEGEEADSDLAVLSKALGHPARVRIMRMLSKNNTCVCGEIVAEVDLAQSTVSQHLKVLKEAGLIRGDIEGTSTCYCLDPRGLRRLKVLVAGI